MVEDKIQNIMGQNQYSAGRARLIQKTPAEILREGVKKSTQITDEQTVDMLVDKAMKGDSYLKNGTYDVFLFGIAESLESIRCGTSSVNEYFTWIKDAQHIMDHMTDGMVTESDLLEKKAFIDNSKQRENDLLTCLALYERRIEDRKSVV